MNDRLRLVLRSASGMNRTEAAYALVLAGRQQAGELLWWGFERVTLKLADDCRYTVDFIAVTAEGRLAAYEVKGHMRDDARVKLKVAAAQFPWIEFYLVRRAEGTFTVELVA